ncbi:MAG: hypothetical protein N2505_00315 [Endomicrobia bacterium]|nr:hypothetical protein [Endomicrobiia bacterium]
MTFQIKQQAIDWKTVKQLLTEIYYIKNNAQKQHNDFINANEFLEFLKNNDTKTYETLLDKINKTVELVIPIVFCLNQKLNNEYIYTYYKALFLCVLNFNIESSKHNLVGCFTKSAKLWLKEYIKRQKLQDELIKIPFAKNENFKYFSIDSMKDKDKSQFSYDLERINLDKELKIIKNTHDKIRVNNIIQQILKADIEEYKKRRYLTIISCFLQDKDINEICKTLYTYPTKVKKMLREIRSIVYEY